MLTTLSQEWVLMHKDLCMTAITMVWWESLWAFPKSCRLKPAPVAMVANRKTKSAHNSTTRWVPASKLLVWVSTQWQSWWCSQYSCRPFRLLLLTKQFTYLILFYVAIFSLFQECNEFWNTRQRLLATLLKRCMSLNWRNDIVGRVKCCNRRVPS